MPTLRSGLAAAVVQSGSGPYVLYAIGGRNNGNVALARVEAYNASTNTWTRKASLPTKRYNPGAEVIGGKIYVVGGSDVGSSATATKTLYVYTPSTNTWARKADLPIASARQITGVFDKKLYVLLTECAGFSFCSRLYRYDPASNGWTRRADPPHWHKGGIGTVINGKFIVAWGETDILGGSPVSTYNPATNRWTWKKTAGFGGSCPPQETAFVCSVRNAAGANLNGQLYSIGGENDDDVGDAVITYNAATNVWTWGEKAWLRTSRALGATGKVKNAAGVLQLILVGGFDQEGEPHPTTEAFTP
jgi:N-acetylneuraminic acid mutarotase